MNSSVWIVWAARKKSGFEFFSATFEGAFLTFCGQKKKVRIPFECLGGGGGGVKILLHKIF
jgi:hypothetical protein